MVGRGQDKEDKVPNKSECPVISARSARHQYYFK